MHVAELTDGFAPLPGSATGVLEAWIHGMPEVDFEIITNLLRMTAVEERIGPNAIVRRIPPTDPVTTALGRSDVGRTGVFPYKIAADWIRFHRKVRRLCEGSFDVVHFNGPLTNYAFFRFDRFLGRPALTHLIDFSNVPVPKVITLHGIPSLLTHSIVDTENERRQINSFGSVIVLDRSVQRLVEPLVKDSPRRPTLHLIPNGIDPEVFAYRDPPADRSLRVGFVGRFAPEKSPRLITDLANDLPDGVQLRLAIAGRMDTSTREALQAIDRVSLLENVPHSRMPDFLASIHLLLNPATHIGVTLTTLEAMSVGRPVIMSPGWDRYPILEGVTGFLRPAAIGEVRPLLEWAKGEPQTLSQMGRRSRNIIEQEFSNSHVAARLKGVFEETVRRGP